MIESRWKKLFSVVYFSRKVFPFNNMVKNVSGIWPFNRVYLLNCTWPLLLCSFSYATDRSDRSILPLMMQNHPFSLCCVVGALLENVILHLCLSGVDERTLFYTYAWAVLMRERLLFCFVEQGWNWSRGGTGGGCRGVYDRGDPFHSGGSPSYAGV